jgi:hypothetical protein
MSAQADSLQQLLRDARLWRGHQQAQVRALPTGYPQLDAVLPGGGWPCAALSEIVYPMPGVGELSLALPLLARLTQQQRRIALIAPPHLPYAPALQQGGVQLRAVLTVEARDQHNALWAAEELLRGGAGAVLLWQDEIDVATQRRLQLAAETSDSMVLLYRRPQQGRDATVAALRLQIARHERRVQVEILKCRGARPGQRYALSS